jgi:hypothetical protein
MADPELQRLISDRIEEFVADITRLAREHAVKTLAEALDVDTDGGAGGDGRRKRRPDELDRLADDIEAFIRDNPGELMSDIAEHFEATPRELALPVRRLKDAGRVRTEGQRRATRYFAARKKR